MTSEYGLESKALIKLYQKRIRDGKDRVIAGVLMILVAMGVGFWMDSMGVLNVWTYIPILLTTMFGGGITGMGLAEWQWYSRMTKKLKAKVDKW